MPSFVEAIDKYVAAAADFESRLQAALGTSRSIEFRIEEKVRFFKVLFWRKGLDSGVWARIDLYGNIYDFLYGPHFGVRGIVGNVLTGKYGFPEIPEAGSPQNAVWTAWYETFSEIPLSLAEEFTKLLEKGDLDTITEAIQITGSKRDPIHGNDARIRYIYGILRHKLLESVAPERAAEMKTIFSLQQYWQHQPRGSGYLNRSLLKKWLQVCTPDEIRSVMNSAGGLWADLKDEMERIVSARKASQTAAQ